MRIEAKKLWKQTLYETDVAELLLINKRYAAAAFHAQQAAEMAFKAVYVEQKANLFLRHNLDELASRLEAPTTIRRAAAALLPIYLASRYADARQDDASPSEAITETDATEALNNAHEVIAWCNETLTRKSSSSTKKC